MANELLPHLVPLLGQATQVQTTEDIDRVLEGAAQAVASLLPADRVAIIALARGQNEIQRVAAGGPGRAKILPDMTVDELTQGLTGWVLLTGETAVSPRGTVDPRESEAVRRRRQDTECGDILVAPLRLGDRILGTLTAINTPADPPFDQGSAETVGLFADLAAVVMALSETIGRQRTAGEELFRQVTLRSRLLTVLAHDLRGPLGALVSLLSLAQTQGPGAPHLPTVLATAETSTQRVLQLVDDLLAWVQGYHGLSQGLDTCIVVEDLLAEEQALAEVSAQAKGLTLRVEATSRRPVKAEAGSVKVIVRNLLSNAVKFSPAGRSIVVTLRDQGPMVDLAVRDQGVGLTAAQQHELFGVDRVMSHRGTEGERGHGLGLVFSQDLARACGGFLSVESEVGAGSTFHLWLPACEG